MNKKILMLTSALTIGVLVASCSKSENSSNSNSSSTSGGISIPNTSVDIKNDGTVDLNTAQLLINGAKDKDIDNAKKSIVTTVAIGYDSGRRYQQSSRLESTSYKDDLTIGTGTIEHFFYDNQDNVLKDTFDEVYTIKSNNYIYMRKYKNGIFVNQTEKKSLLNSTDPVELEYNYATARAEVSCGAGLDAYIQFFNALVEAGGQCLYGSATDKVTNNVTLYFQTSYESTDTNQLRLSTFVFQFDSARNGFLQTFDSTQSLYSLDIYNAAEDKSQIQPTYYSKQLFVVEKGTLTDFTGDLPVDLDSSFVQQINVASPKTIITVGETIAITWEVLPTTALNKTVMLSSKNENVARVDEDGRVTGISKGKAVISVLNPESGVEGTIEIEVVDKSQGDAGDDSKKGPLKAALQEAFYQLFKFDSMSHGESILGMCLSSDIQLNAKKLRTLTISEFAYDENLRKATYVGDLSKLIDILPFKDNGNANVSNDYLQKEFSIYHDNILGLEVYLKGDNTISYMRFTMRTDSASMRSAEFATLTNENVQEVMGQKSDFKVGYDRKVVFESAGFSYPDDNE